MTRLERTDREEETTSFTDGRKVDDPDESGITSVGISTMAKWTDRYLYAKANRAKARTANPLIKGAITLYASPMTVLYLDERESFGACTSILTEASSVTEL